MSVTDLHTGAKNIFDFKVHWIIEDQISVQHCTREQLSEQRLLYKVWVCTYSRECVSAHACEGDCVWVSETALASVCTWHWLYLWIAMAIFDDNFNASLFLSICVQKHTHKGCTNTHATIVIHSTVRSSMSYPVWTVGSCPNKGASHSLIALFSFISHTNVVSF